MKKDEKKCKIYLGVGCKGKMEKRFIYFFKIKKQIYLAILKQTNHSSLLICIVLYRCYPKNLKEKKLKMFV